MDQDCEVGEEKRLVDESKRDSYGTMGESGAKDAGGTGRTRLPYKQLFLVIAMLFTEPMAYSQVYPVRAFSSVWRVYRLTPRCSM